MIRDASWVDFVWSMFSAASATLGLACLGLWLARRRDRAFLLFAIAALSMAVLGALELAMMRSLDPAVFVARQRSAQVAGSVAGLALAGFVHVFLAPARRWLLWTFVGSRLAVLLLNVTLPIGIAYARLPELERIELAGGARVTIAHGSISQGSFLATASWAIFAVLVADCTARAWRRGGRRDRRQAILVGGSALVLASVSPVVALLIHLDRLALPYLNAPLFLLVLAGMAGELGAQLSHAVEVGEELQATTLRLRDHEVDAELATDAARLAFWTFDPATGRIWSPRGAAWLGYAAGEPFGIDGFLGRFDAAEVARIRGQLAESLSARGPLEGELRLAGPDGDSRRIAYRGRVDVEESGPRVRGVAFDVTELRQAEERLRLVVDSTPMALLMIDREGQIVLANARAASYFGFPTDGLVGRRIEAMVPEAKPTGTEFQSSSLADSRRRTALADGELQAQRLDGSVFPVEVSVAQISDGARELYLVSVVDVSDRTRVEATLARQRSELAHLSRVTVLGELSASIAHELNQPLAAILANAQTAQRLLTRDRVDLDELREILDDVVADDKRAGEVIRGLRSMLRKEEQVHVPLQINEVVEEVLQIVRSDLIHRRVAVELELASRLPQVAGDRVQLQQVLLNLILNGCEAMSGEPLARLLSIRTVAGATGEVEVTITDRGAGVPAHVADRLFEPFVTTKPQGTGLGLAVCRTIVGAHHGRISVTNDAGAGATARVVLPALRESALTRTAGARAAPS